VGNDGVGWIDVFGLRELTNEQSEFMEKAHKLMFDAKRNPTDIQLRLKILENVFRGMVDSIGDNRNPDYWEERDGVFQVKPGKLPTDAISNMWEYEGGEAYCLKYSSLILMSQE